MAVKKICFVHNREKWLGGGVCACRLIMSEHRNARGDSDY